MKLKTYTPLAIAALLAGSAQAATVIASARTGYDVGSGSTNPNNGAAWATPTSAVYPHFPNRHEAHAVGGVTTAAFVGAGNGRTPQTFSYHVTDTATAVDFTFDLVLTAFSKPSGGGSYSATSRRASAVDGPTNGENRDRTEFLANNGSTEFWRTTMDLGSITVASAHDVTFASWDAVNLSQVTLGAMGEIRVSGGTNAPGAGASLLSFNNGTTGVQALAANSASSIDWVPTAGAAATGFQAKGFVVSFDVNPAVAIPEPSSTALLGLAGFALILRRRK